MDLLLIPYVGLCFERGLQYRVANDQALLLGVGIVMMVVVVGSGKKEVTSNANMFACLTE